LLSKKIKTRQYKEMDQLRQLAFSLKVFLNQPRKVFFTSVIVLMLTLFLNGTLWKLWGLYRDQKTIVDQTVQSQAQILSIDGQLKQAKDPAFIERQARDKMDLVGDHDLIFVFPE